MDSLFLSSSSALFLLLLQKAGGGCPSEALTIFLGSTADIPFILNECKNANLIDIDEYGNVRLLKEMDEEQLISSFHFFSSKYSSSSLAFCVSSFVSNEYTSFFSVV